MFIKSFFDIFYGKAKTFACGRYGNLREDYARELRRVGFMVRAVREGNGFYELLKVSKFDLIVSDSDMPHICGDGVCQKASEEEGALR